jgi:hypothetical protein
MVVLVRQAHAAASSSCYALLATRIATRCGSSTQLTIRRSGGYGSSVRRHLSSMSGDRLDCSRARFRRQWTSASSHHCRVYALCNRIDYRHRHGEQAGWAVRLGSGRSDSAARWDSSRGTPDMQILKTSLDTVAHGDLDRVLGDRCICRAVLDTSACAVTSVTFRLVESQLSSICCVPPRRTICCMT